MKNLVLGLATLLITATGAMADRYQDAMRVFYADNIMQWASDPVLVAAIKAQNAATADYDQATIDDLDKQWRSYVYIPNAEMIRNVLSNPAAEFLRTQINNTGGAITEAFIMDAHGLNVAASGATSDYWQGDEAKFQQTYDVGPEGLHFGAVELDDSTGTLQGQISLTVVDPETGEMVGALTVGVDLKALL